MKNKFLKNVIATMSILVLATGVLTGCGDGNGASDSASVETEESVSSETADTEASDTEASDADQENVDTADVETVKLGILAGHVLPVVALENGYFDEQGVKVELVSFDTGAAEIEAYTSGELDIVQCGDLPLLNGLSNGLDLQVIGTYNVSDEINGLVVREDAGISSYADLKGKTVSVPFGTNIQPLLYEYLEAGGLTEADVEIVNLNNADGANALITGDVSAAVLWDPYLSGVVENDGIVQIADTKDIRKFVCPISSSTEYINAHADTVRKVLTALNKASNWSQENVDEAARIVSDYFDSDNEDAIKLSINKADSTVPLTQEKVDNLLLGATVCYKYGIVENEVNLEEHINWDFTDLDE
ncbi:MAG: aliphatic sulfonate ABC transporter substrate-binding protein [Lachnospiraceae bacterium]|nr:aliphatic sulfonate ABC transporter substrate-binding protein [Lachnospiraceae bacterium]